MWWNVSKKVLRQLAFSMPVAVTFVDCVAYIAKVEGVSMQPILNPENSNGSCDFVLLNRWAMRHYNVSRGDVVALTSPRNPDHKIIKRVIALEGDTVRTLNRSRHVIRIPRGHCWIEGDHTNRSMDSNYFGPVAMGLIYAKASHVVWPPSRWCRLETYLPNDRMPLNLQPPLSEKDLFIDEMEMVD